MGCTWTQDQLLTAGVCSDSFIPRLSQLLNIFTITSVYYVIGRFCLVGRVPEGQIHAVVTLGHVCTRGDPDSVAHLKSAPSEPPLRKSLASQVST